MKLTDVQKEQKRALKKRLLAILKLDSRNLTWFYHNYFRIYSSISHSSLDAQLSEKRELKLSDVTINAIERFISDKLKNG